MEKKFICIRCPRGCDITTSLDGYGSIMELKGNICRIGEEYIKNEITDPRRILTTTVQVINGTHPLVPVWTASSIPRNKIFELTREIRNIKVEAPVKIGQVIIENALGLGINVVTSGSVRKR